MAFDKVVDSAELDATFTAIGDAIREVKGTTELIPDDQLAAEIKSVNNEVNEQTGLITQLKNIANNLPDAGGSGSAKPMIETIATDKISNLILVNVDFRGGVADDTTQEPT